MDAGKKILLLFDIDGTLLSTDGMAGKLMLKALEEEVGKPVGYELKVFVGATDRLILKQFIEKSRVKIDDPESAIDRVLKRYLLYLDNQMNLPGYVKVLPGINEILNRVADDTNISLGLVTGNIKAGAYAKLKLASLDTFFPIGAFGDDAIERNKLPPIAVRRAENFYQVQFSPSDIWIIGDSPKDIECAKANQFRSLAVASGWHAIKELKPFKPDMLLNDLSKTSDVIEIFKNSGG